MALSAKTKKAIELKKNERLADQELATKVQSRRDRKEGNGLVSLLPAGTYTLADIAEVESNGFEFLQATFLNDDEKEFKISLSACLNPIYNEEGTDINEFEAFGLDQIGSDVVITHKKDVLGLRPIFDNDGQWVVATDKGYKFYSEQRGEHFKGRKTVIMVAEWQ